MRERLPRETTSLFGMGTITLTKELPAHTFVVLYQAIRILQAELLSLSKTKVSLFKEDAPSGTSSF
jgi:hypothetical protein